jgi:hypothetical protein
MRAPVRALGLVAGLIAGAGGQAHAAFHCFYQDTNLGYILEPEIGAVTVWGGIVPQRLQVLTYATGTDPLMTATARTVIDSDKPAPDFLPMVVTERFTLTGPRPARLLVETDWRKHDGSAFPEWFQPTDFAPEPFVPGEWRMTCAVAGGQP